MKDNSTYAHQFDRDIADDNFSCKHWIDFSFFFNLSVCCEPFAIFFLVSFLKMELREHSLYNRWGIFFLSDKSIIPFWSIIIWVAGFVGFTQLKISLFYQSKRIYSGWGDRVGNGTDYKHVSWVITERLRMNHCNMIRVFRYYWIALLNGGLIFNHLRGTIIAGPCQLPWFENSKSGFHGDDFKVMFGSSCANGK